MKKILFYSLLLIVIISGVLIHQEEVATAAVEHTFTLNMSSNYQVINELYETGSGSQSYWIEDGGIVDSGGGGNTVYVENGGIIKNLGGSNKAYIKEGGVVESMGGSNTICAENGVAVKGLGGSNTLYLKNGASFDAGGSGSNIIYYEEGANIINAGGGATLIESSKITCVKEIAESEIEIADVQAINSTSNSITVRWETNLPADSQIKWATSLDELNQVAWTDPDCTRGSSVVHIKCNIRPATRTVHSEPLTGLQPDTKYYFIVRSTAPGMISEEYNGTFETKIKDTQITDYGLKIVRVEFSEISNHQATVYWQAEASAGSGEYRISKDQSELSDLPWFSGNVTNGHGDANNILPEGFRSLFGSEYTFTNLDSGTEYHVELRKTVHSSSDGILEGPAKYVTFITKGENPTPQPNTDDKLQELLDRIKKLNYRISELENQVVELERKLLQKVDKVLTNRLKGRILIQVEEKGEAWYVDEITEQKFYLKDGTSAYQALQAFGLGISNADLEKIPVGFEDRFEDSDTDGDGLQDKMEEALGTDVENPDSDGDGFNDGAEVRGGFNPLGEGTLDTTFLGENLKGKIVLQVESRGEAWYIHPEDGKRYYMKDGPAAYQIMRFLSLGITNDDIRKIDVGSFE
jgi:hypothetical protein